MQKVQIGIQTPMEGGKSWLGNLVAIFAKDPVNGLLPSCTAYQQAMGQFHIRTTATMQTWVSAVTDAYWKCSGSARE